MTNNVNIGAMDRMVTVQYPVRSTGNEGQRVTSFVTHSVVAASVETSVSETVGDGNYEAGCQISITIYRIESLDTRWRVLIDGKPFKIVSSNILGRMSPFEVLSLNAIDV